MDFAATGDWEATTTREEVTNSVESMENFSTSKDDSSKFRGFMTHHYESFCTHLHFNL